MASFSLTTVSNVFKEKYGKLSDNVYNSANVTLGRIKKSYNFTGKQMFVPIPQSYAGGVGSGSLPTANSAKVEDAIITAKKMYGVVQIDRESLKAASNDEGSFVRLTKFAAEKGVESYMRNLSRAIFNNGTGSIARGDATTNVSGAGTTGNPYIVVLNSDTKEANIEEKDYWHYNAETGTGALLEVVDYNPTTKAVSLVGASVGLAALTGVGPVLSTVYFHMQNSKDNDPTGFAKSLLASSGSLYTVPVTRRWQAHQKDAAGGGLIPDLMNEMMLEVQRKCGKVPNLIVTSFTQYRKLLNSLEDQKAYYLEPRAQDLKGKVSFRGVEFQSSAGPVGVFAERFMEKDSMYFLNDNYIEMFHRPDHGWFDDDGSVFLRTTGDEYEARYGGYLELYTAPSFHGALYGLAT